MRKLLRCVPCAAVTIATACLVWTADALAQPLGPTASISAEAWLGLIATALFALIAGYMGRLDREIREHKGDTARLFEAVSKEQRQQQTQITLLVEKLGDRPGRHELNDLRVEIAGQFDKLHTRLDDALRR